MSISVLLVDDHKMLREGIKQLLEFDRDIVVSDQASNGAECKEYLQKNRYDVVVLDINLPDTSGIKLIPELKKIDKKISILILTVHNEIDYLVEAMNNGANGYILKDSGSSELINAIKSVFVGDKYIQADLIPAYNSRLLKMEDDISKSKDITKREKQILASIALGKSNKDIADEFNISERTVKNHITSLFKKIDVSDRTQAAVYAIRNNFVKI